MEQSLSVKMKDYLKMAVDLEASIYRQEQALSAAQKELLENKPQKEILTVPEKHVPIKPLPEPPEKDIAGVKVSIFILASVSLGFGIFSVFRLKSLDTGILCMIFGVFFVYILVYKLIESSKKNTQNKLAYQRALEEYEERIKQYENKYKNDVQQYKKDLRIAEQDYQRKLTHYNKAVKAVSKMKVPLEETKATLEKLYANNWLFPKYRNMVAVCTIYEYFATERCSQLTGPDGAYNLYEMELRQNMIINQLETIASHLEAIKRNQYTLYMELTEAKKAVDGIRSDVKSIRYEAMEIANATHISAQLAQVTAKNTDAIKYISLING